MIKPSSINQILFGIISIVALIAILVFSAFSSNGYKGALSPTTEVTQNEEVVPTENAGDGFSKTLQDTLNQITQQEEVDKSILAELESGAYSFENPLVVVDPYGNSPLTALILFSTIEPNNISIHIEGEDQYTNIDFAFEGFNKQHIIPVYGLYPGIENKVTLTAKNQSGKTDEVQLRIQTESLPKELADQIFLVDAPYKAQYQPGLNFTFENGQLFSKTAFDINGKFRWFLTRTYLHATEYKFGNRYIFAEGASNVGDVLLFEMNPLGRIYTVFYSPFGVHHDIEKYFNNILVTGSNGNTIQDFIYEISTVTGEINNFLDLKTIFQRSRQTGFTPVDHYDWFHQNAISWVEGQENIVISSRYQSLVAEISWPHGEISWMLAPHYGWLPMFDKYLLEPIGEPFDWPSNQHSPEIMPDMDDNPDTTDILLFDNGIQLIEGTTAATAMDSKNMFGLSSMVNYRINVKEMSVEQIWQFGKELGPHFFSSSRGDANLLENGNRLGVFNIADPGSTTNVGNGTYFEVSDQSKIIWSAQTLSQTSDGELIEYRLERMNIYNSDANNLEIGTSVINFIPQEIIEKYAITQ